MSFIIEHRVRPRSEHFKKRSSHLWRDKNAHALDAPGQDVADDAWNRHDRAVGVLLGERTFVQRCRLRLDPMPVFRRDLARGGSTKGGS